MNEKTLGQIASQSCDNFNEQASTSQYFTEKDLIEGMWDFIAQAVIEAHESRKRQPLPVPPKQGE